MAASMAHEAAVEWSGTWCCRARPSKVLFKTILRAQGGKHTDQGAAGRSNKGKAGNWEEECEQGQRQRGWRGRQEYISSTNPLTILKVKLMEIHSLHKVTKGLRLKGSKPWIANLPAGKKRKAACQCSVGITCIFQPCQQCLSCSRLAVG